MKVSVVICTLNRGPFLKRLLDSLKHVTYRDFEVVVVNGPSKDDTAEILKDYQGAVKIGSVSQANLSCSRNAGIRASAGDIVAFLDDDAIPSKDWLDDIVSLYEDPRVGGVGGVVIDGADMTTIQNRNLVMNQYGVPLGNHDEPQDFNDPDGEVFNIMLGCNCSFRRSVLLEVGGFDEYYEYYHDESDTAFRIIRAGYRIMHHPKATVYHSYAASDLRDDNRVLKNWWPVLKNTAYFAVKNADLRDVPEKDRRNLLREQLKVYRDNSLAGTAVYTNDYRKRYKLYQDAFSQGYEDGRNLPRATRDDLDAGEEFLPFEAAKMPNHKCIALFCKGDIQNPIGGIAKYSAAMAAEFARQGHNVHLFTMGTSNSYLRDNINYHFVSAVSLEGVDKRLDVSPVVRTTLEYSYGLSKKVRLVDAVYHIDCAEGALWDYDGLMTARLSDVPVAVRVETPSLVVGKIQNWPKTDDLTLHGHMERAYLGAADGVIYISNAIRETIEENYDVDFRLLESHLCYLGFPDAQAEPAPEKPSRTTRIFFVGRLERRKGVQNLIDAMEEVFDACGDVEFVLAGQNDIVDPAVNMTFADYFQTKYGRKSWKNRVKFPGIISDEEKDEEMSRCAVFVSPSLFESFGIIFVEAMIRGKPVIGCRTGGMKEVVDDENTGILVEPDDTHALAQAIIRLIRDEKLRGRMGENGRARYDKLFSIDACIRESLKIYEDVARRAKDRGKGKHDASGLRKSYPADR
jgi:glycosyltransferase involved in cell wall biosynthesis/GT2 family glycosyltransferase